MHVLIIGGTGIISTFVVEACLEHSMNLTVMNRGNDVTALPKGVRHLRGDIRDASASTDLLENQFFDAVIQFVAFTQQDVERDIRMFKGKTKQYIFISSASAYQKPPKAYPITENTPLENPYWSYSRNKIACEQFLQTVTDIPVTIVRPSHTYNNTMIMAMVARWGFEYAHLKRIIEGKPVIVAGEGTSLWTLTHGSDFARSFVPLIGNQAAYGEAFHITSEKVYTWDSLTHITADALGVKADIVHIPTEVITSIMPEMTGPLLGDKTWSAVFDNTKIRTLSPTYTSRVGYEDVVSAVIKHYQDHTELHKVSDPFETLYDRLIAKVH
ncbi:MAG: SDR family oxidoreductase [Acholeplasmatales bacterium]|nr:MAG: SDR family oxidoreductase [Acholeplasmatales bacterium]